MEFKVRGNFSVEDRKTGGSRVIRNNLITKINFPITDIYAYEEVVSSAGKIKKNSCRLYLTNDLKEVVVNKSYEFIEQLKGIRSAEITIKGFYERHSK